MGLVHTIVHWMQWIGLMDWSTQIQFQWNQTSVVPPYIGCNGLVHPNPLQNVKKTKFSSFRPLLLWKLIIFSTLIQIEWSKVLWECHLKFYISSWNSKGSRTTFKDYLVFSEQFPNVGCGIFLTFWPCTFWRAMTFSFLIHFWQFVVLSMRYEEFSNFSFNTINKGTLL